MKKTVLIIEDDLDQLTMLKLLVESLGDNITVYTAQNMETAYHTLMESTIDVFMVDIILNTGKPGDTSGMRLVEKIRRISKYMFTPVIFITSLEDPTMYAYRDLNCIGYVEKPYDILTVKALVQKALNYTTKRIDEISLTFRRDGILYPVRLKDIVYAESINHVMNIHLSNGSCLEIPYKTCKQILQEADSGILMQCSRNALVNKEYIEGLDMVNRYILLKEKRGRVNIGITYKKRVLAEYGDDCCG